MQNNISNELLPIQRNIRHIESKAANKAIVICYSDRAVAEQAINHLEKLNAKLGIDRVEYVFSGTNFNVIPYFNHQFEFEEFNNALNPTHYLVA